MYLGLNAWQSPNGIDILGTVLYWLIKEEEGGFHLEAVPLDFVRLQKSHTGAYLAKTVQLIVEKFGLKEKIHGIVTDNALNNQTIIKEIKSYRWPLFKGKTHWICCFAHILNLIAQVILKRFGCHKKKSVSTVEPAQKSDNKQSDKEEPDDQDDQIRLLSVDSADEDEDSNNENDSTVDESILAGELIDKDEVELKDEDVNNLSDEGEDDQYTSISCAKTLAKFRAISRKLKKSPNSKAHFVEICRDLDFEWQKDQQHSLSQDHYINDNDIQLACDLAKLLQQFYEITKQVSTRGAAQIADIFFFIDQITCHLSTAISNKRDNYPPALRNACCLGLQLKNKYYTLTDCLPLYRFAMNKYFKLEKWKPKWIQESIRLTREMWETHYKPSPKENNSQPTTNPHPKKHAGVLAGLASASEARGGTAPTDPLSMWFSGGLS
ncbi:hypothetical protein PCANC_17092 [Puccinia coronata f. sp. avenae]|uniref:DUF659 domain-containing protein n=1 Tax=Puccinia coronata f. sp. avenae TaxID=200324 RepID=A0A2N5ST19_9BASI|nr:hypothetical protein PCANC_17092 [Puccinia coronata f. sp. avenae]